MGKVLERSSYTPGRKFRVVDLPGDPYRLKWAPPHRQAHERGPSYLITGDIVTVSDIPFEEPHNFPGYTNTINTFFVNYKTDTCSAVIPPEFLEPVAGDADTEGPPRCTCNIMVTGCICGAFQREQGLGNYATGT